jgi:hypothetical protein
MEINQNVNIKGILNALNISEELAQLILQKIGGGGSGTGSIYLHNVELSTGLPYNVTLDLYTTTATPINTIEALFTLIGNNDHLALYNGSEATGSGYMIMSSTGELYFSGVCVSSYDSNTVVPIDLTAVQITSVTDTVKQV